MRELTETIESWRARGDAVAIATLVAVRGSAPCPIGAKMAVNQRGEIAGSVSGGCVETSLVETALQVIDTGCPQLVHFGIAGETAWSTGLMCGGEIDVFVEKLDSGFDDFARLVRAQQRFVVRTLIRGDGAGAKTIAAGAVVPAPQVTGVDSSGATFVEVIDPPPVLYIVGASHIAIALVTIAKVIGYRVVVVDPRQAFATPERFARADALVIDYPQRALTPEALNTSACVAVLTHDPKIDDPALILALGSQARYVGALGSRKTHALRIERLKRAGLTGAQLARLRAPIGLDIGARTPSEIALAIAAEMVASREAATLPS